MGGWKTWVSAIGLILTGLGLVASAFASEPLDVARLTEGVTTIMAGLAVIGIGHKIEKN